jgi:hypothetical protein
MQVEIIYSERYLPDRIDPYGRCLYRIEHTSLGLMRNDGQVLKDDSAPQQSSAVRAHAQASPVVQSPLVGAGGGRTLRPPA